MRALIRNSAPRLVAGFGTLEALVALLVLSLGLLGLGHLMLRQSAQGRAASGRAIALQHIDALRESMALNPAASRGGDYLLDWHASRTAAVDCLAAACTPRQQADHDLAQWRGFLLAALPGADATVFRADPDQRRFGIVVAWPAPPDNVQSPPVAAIGIDCPPTFLCHGAYVEP